MLDLIDTHCHLDYEPLGQDLEAVLARAAAAGVRQCITIGTTVEASRANVAIVRRFPQSLRAAVGIHPQDAATATSEALEEIAALAQEPEVAAIGEVGLDYYRQPGPDADQIRALRFFTALAQRRDLPILIHCRNAYDELLAVLRECARVPLRGLIHCASGPAEFIRGALELGLHISFSGTATFPNAKATRDLIPLVPDDRILVETDSPFLAPQPVRGKPNEPAYVAHTAAAIAPLRGLTADAFASLTSRNARALFRLPIPN